MSDYVNDKVIEVLQKAHAAGIPLGGICTGAYALLAAKLLDGYRRTLHWEDMSPVN